VIRQSLKWADTHVGKIMAAAAHIHRQTAPLVDT